DLLAAVVAAEGGGLAADAREAVGGVGLRDHAELRAEERLVLLTEDLPEQRVDEPEEDRRAQGEEEGVAEGEPEAERVPPPRRLHPRDRPRRLRGRGGHSPPRGGCGSAGARTRGPPCAGAGARGPRRRSSVGRSRSPTRAGGWRSSRRGGRRCA